MKYDVIIIGGSFAGLSAALPLARARKNVLVVDAGLRRNRFATHSHNFLAQDGHEPASIIANAKHQLEKYSSIVWLNASVIDVQVRINHYEVFTEAENNNYTTFQTEKIIIATGVKDELPQIDGLAERWGKSIFHCPYCDGYELNLGQIGVLYSGTHSLHMALMLPDWGNTTLFLNGIVLIDAIEPALRDQLKQRHVKLDTRKIAKIQNHCELKFENGDQTQLDGLFISTFMRIQSPWVRRLGLNIDSNEYGEALSTNTFKQTNLNNIYACGDITRSGGSVAFSVADGAMAGVAAHKSFVFGG
ncbi:MULTISPECIES: NAD(P)/FAD-dependent oxidoreductase [unclassified Acinetobacter]|uniref:NAD(P)/FAD-dependent oxidoreductase n=1 Tax=unclassified Acinetobacter TaxID=196816 RepID=UPI0018AADA6D|nr:MULTISPECIES: NAD(P)/FAD-dependent oxidoreductase [unclassified Acinetobacter]MBJ9955064.1 NAD(P)/FAD-dependent oxidoreductase [Acinetobacter baumannii]